MRTYAPSPLTSSSTTGRICSNRLPQPTYGRLDDGPLANPLPKPVNARNTNQEKLSQASFRIAATKSTGTESCSPTPPTSRIHPLRIPFLANLHAVLAHHPPLGRAIRPVHKSPSLTVVENWLSTVVSTVAPTVSRTICFQARPGSSEAGPTVRKSPARSGNGCLLSPLTNIKQRNRPVSPAYRGGLTGCYGSAQAASR